MQIMKLRGQASLPGLRTFRITEAGLQAFSRTPVYLAKGIKSTHGDREGEHIAHSTAFRPARGLILNT